MQYYRDGYTPGDPARHPAKLGPGGAAPDAVDVLIVGSGPAGNLLGAYLSQFSDITTRIIERRTGRLELGQADGVACRTVETFAAFGLAHKLTDEAYWVNETSFWRPDPRQPQTIVRTGRVRDVRDGLSEFPHLIVNQARVHDHLLDFMERSPTRLVPDYGCELTSVTVDRTADLPVTARVLRTATGETVDIRTKYLVGTDGAHSVVRKSMGLRMKGESAGHAWGVMDVLADSDFPDIRLKSAIQSHADGSILLIPREGGYMVRLYVDLGEVDETNRAEVRQSGIEEIVAAANRVMHPYSIDVRETVWWSIYEVGQRLTERFDDAVGAQTVPRVFIAGDACHTHSAKAGQGMNVSMQDTYNLGWKLSAVLRGLAAPELLATYSQERQPVAQQLIDFDREWSTLMAARADGALPEEADLAGENALGGEVDPAGGDALGEQTDPVGGDALDAHRDPDELQSYFVRAGEYTAGLGIRYTDPPLTGAAAEQERARGFRVGTRFHSAPVTRLADAKAMELGHVHRADGRFRVYLFADRSESEFVDVCTWLWEDSASPIVRHTPEGWNIDDVIDVLGIVQRPHREVELASLPPLLRPRTGRYGLIDHEKAYSALTDNGDIFTERGIDRAGGAAVIVRPDQYIAEVLALDDHRALTDYFASVLL